MNNQIERRGELGKERNRKDETQKLLKLCFLPPPSLFPPFCLIFLHHFLILAVTFLPPFLFHLLLLSFFFSLLFLLLCPLLGYHSGSTNLSIVLPSPPFRSLRNNGWRYHPIALNLNRTSRRYRITHQLQRARMDKSSVRAHEETVGAVILTRWQPSTRS